MKKNISLILSLLFLLFLGICIYYATQVEHIEGEATSLHEISDLIKIKHFPKGIYKYIFKRNMLTNKYSLKLYGKININSLKYFCNINIFRLQHFPPSEVGSPLAISKEFHNKKNNGILLLQDFHLIKRDKKNKDLHIKIYMYVLKNGNFYAFITNNLRSASGPLMTFPE